ncbi:hypothetical protein SAVIM40S_05398 [Streptomyces avidinii]
MAPRRPGDPLTDEGRPVMDLEDAGAVRVERVHAVAFPARSGRCASNGSGGVRRCSRPALRPAGPPGSLA